jgi:exonuclease III
MEINIRGVTFINHGVEKGNNKGGVAILLNRRAEKAWNAAGRPDPYKSGALAVDNTRILMIELLFQPRKRQSTRLLVTSVYAPQSGITAKNPEFIQHFYKALGNITSNATTKASTSPGKKFLIMGGDWNASIGTRVTQGPNNARVLGMNGIDHTNEAGEKLLEFAPRA